jgi:ubiquinone/menaquinone biosynthesis C-methylase UbiE
MKLRVFTCYQCIVLAGLLLMLATAEPAEQSVNPGINRAYANPDWQQWVARFERPGREVYDRRHAIVDASFIGPGMTVADIGAGTGLFTRLFARRVGANGKVYAVDISRTFVDNIVHESEELGISNVVGVVNSERNVYLPADSIDVAFVADTYHHFEYPSSMLASIRTALYDGGKMIVIDFRRDPRVSSDWVMRHVRAGRETVIDEIEAAGFDLVEEKPLLRSNYFLVFRKSEP